MAVKKSTFLLRIKDWFASVFSAIAAFLIIREARHSKQLVKSLLNNSINAISTTPNDFRATIFTVRNDGMLSTYSSTDNEYNGQDKLGIPLTSIVAGLAWFESKPAYRDYSKDDIEAWNLNPKQMGFSDQVRSSLAIPIQNSEGGTIGVLSIDSKNPLIVSGLSDENRIKATLEIANRLSKALIEATTSKKTLLPKIPVLDDEDNNTKNYLSSSGKRHFTRIEFPIPAFSFTNKNGSTYFLHSKVVTTKTGKSHPLYFFSKEKKEEVLEAVPQGYKVFETANGLPMLKKS